MTPIMSGYFDNMPQWREVWIVTAMAVLLSFVVTGSLYLSLFGFNDRFWNAMVLAVIVPWSVSIPLSWYMSDQRAKLSRTAKRLMEAEEELQKANSELKRRANYDGLTGLPNREHFFDRIEGIRAAPTSSILMMLDVDNFKQINDSFGHPVGDEALILLAKAFRKILRRDDMVGRIGGEEFGILLPDTSEAEGQIIGEMIRHEVENTKFEPRENIRHVMTVSIGITNAAPHHERSRLMRNADAALFEAKRRGRNKVVMFEPGMRAKRRPSADVESGLLSQNLRSISR